MVKPKEQSTYLTSAQLNLVRTSYMKGCLDAKNIILKQKKAYSYDQCRELAELHEKSIKDILEFEEKK